MTGPGTGPRSGGEGRLDYTAKGIFFNWKLFDQINWY